MGAWSADLEVGSPTALEGRVDLLSGGQVLKGAIERGGVHEGVWRGLVVGGAGGLARKVTARHYTSPTLGLVLAAVAKDAGESVSGTSSAAILGTQLAHWTTIVQTAAQAIRCLMDFAPADVVWRVLPDGTIWVGQDAFADSGITGFAEIGETPSSGLVEVMLEQTPFLLPGTKLGDRRVDTAEISVGRSRITAKIWVAP